MKQKEAGLRKNITPLLRAMMMQMAPMTMSVRLIRANMPEATLRPGGGCGSVSLLEHIALIHSCHTDSVHFLFLFFFNK